MPSGHYRESTQCQKELGQTNVAISFAKSPGYERSSCCPAIVLYSSSVASDLVVSSGQLPSLVVFHVDLLKAPPTVYSVSIK